MGRPSKLTPEQWAEIERRLAAGEGVRPLAREFGISATRISERFSAQTEHVQKVAHQLADAQTALAELPRLQQYRAVTLAEQLRSISSNLASAADYGAKTAHRLQALANSQVAKVDDADPMKSIAELRDVGVLTKLANDSSSIALNLMAANKERIKELMEPPPEEQETPLRPQISREEWLKQHGLA